MECGVEPPHSIRGFPTYCPCGSDAFTQMVTVLLLTAGLPGACTESCTGTEFPAGVPAGICALIWNSPTKPGAAPENETAAACPLIDTVSGYTVKLKGGEVAPGSPAASAGFVGPRPVV